MLTLPQILDALAASDRAVLRTLEAGIAISAEWIAYRAILRKLVNADDLTDTVLPELPKYQA